MRSKCRGGLCGGSGNVVKPIFYWQGMEDSPMVSHENRVIAGAMLFTAAILATLFAAESWLGFRLSEAPLVGFLLFTGVSIWLPQLYLARTDTTVDPHLRLRVAVLLTML